jgi:DNA-binding NarL/FixJ family response regulator
VVAAPVRVLLVEDNDAFRETLELLFGLRDEIEVVGSLGDGARAPEVCRELDPDVLLLDYRLPGLDAVDVTRAVHGSCPRVAVVCLTGAASEGELAELERVGCEAILTKDAHLDEIVVTLQRAAGRVAA